MTDKPEVMSGESLDVAAQRRDELKQLFPGVFTETKDADGNVVSSIDFERLKAELGTFSDVYEGRRERYGMEWPGKRDCMKAIQEPSRATLKPCPDESVDWDTTKNLFIEGDNLEVLKLLQKSYYGKVKMIYIDPPYNTGNEFIYPDNYQETLDTYLAYAGLLDDEGKKFSTNTASEGRYHTRWLNMMYPRLFLAKNLLKEDGVIFISIDDNEYTNLRKICDEIFGEENFRACIEWQKKYSVSNNFKGIASIRDHILIYSKSDRFQNGLLPRTKDSVSRYTNPDEDPRGPWKAVDYWNVASIADRPNLVYPIENPFTGNIVTPSKKAWKYSKEVHESHVKENKIWWGKNGKNEVPALKLFLSEVKDGLIPNNWWPHTDSGHTDEAKKQLDRLFGGESPFDTPKPIRLIKKMFQIAGLNDGDIVLDFFAGSGTTGEALYQYSVEESKESLSYILVQLPESCEENSIASKLGLSKISDICLSRLKKAAASNREENNYQSGIFDFGVKKFSLGNSCFKIWESRNNADSYELQKSLELYADNSIQDESESSILYEILLKAGFELTESVIQLELEGKLVFSVANGALLVCIDEQLTSELIDAIIALEPMQFICLDKGFQGNDQLKANTAQAFKARSQDSDAEMVFKVV